MNVGEVMNPKIYKVSPEESLYTAFKTLHEKGVRRVFIEEENAIVGVVSYRDLVNVFVNKGVFELIDTKIKDFAIKDVLKISKNEDVAHAAQIMLHADVSGLLVIDEYENPVGVVSQTDVLRVLVREFEQ
ncbi:CBS domain-containing protein [Methanococcus voltae]|uniref:Transcriptional regulator n=2 Tax=Methanococcus voltae TaxID=2188 RepID=A0ABT2EW21_METVO|nr:CBS domain-containing protein [Methanococcus voltae]MBP2172946.1 putative transcriptional regulator [Methanococcus voltae]MBP2201998.1 putative transcriptional regulator [Methanococcus voltae]MCS3922161.1 putative transcriptional regulator [Methanococcus voltae PS]